ncbi:PepSY-like domain-containing protein [Faecalibacter macacae]|uniref:Putative beta-lactamase-inhibitor-like PepSY-like domain-containing protein n=1 Tax=Faecalibacter macacae TaxID=1859289 RepID=A0A3L9MG24_9FLAO|nr:PepSY-like domain-containing protein [Faecalibacter macacae]RLZ11848.1 hypothetical protein EAH69_02700 [Faecalibacter macacae]
MKNIVSVILIALGTSVFAQDQIVTFNQLPTKGQNFISKYFQKGQVSTVILDNDYISKDYDVVLTNGTKIEFDGKGNWKEVDGKRNAIPTTFIPQSILNYVNKSFPNTKIIKIEKNRFSYDVELTNGLDLEFDSKGNFVRIDD